LLAADLLDARLRIAELEKDAERWANVTEFDLGPREGHGNHWSNRLLVQRREGFKLPKQPYMWAVKWDSYNLTRNGEWEYEPIPSERDEDFYSRCRFDSLDEAWANAIAAQRQKEGE
jgi:hypothetical protein